MKLGNEKAKLAVLTFTIQCGFAKKCISTFQAFNPEGMIVL